MRVRFWPALRRAGIGGCVAEVPLRLTQRVLDPGCPVVLFPRYPFRAYYDPRQITREQAVELVKIIAPPEGVAACYAAHRGGTGSRAGCPPAG